ncbi:microtubule organization protein AKNA [Choloepus didactylus]|uniref:microtubule organization protein AKNA n=1 Tax=Choloepus didactylus TaxID=27675 RepID=UPI00189D7202|nr:microtubule organization protein AKNA [Choloepus didactylus]XP_037654568.1 microtubule organization protein AKNA [Choloepus didactylus]XP_037654569.1 microtubule organization protein AKNA [Choloepus didactylus]XP_037654570.1 microtubule organization protein AKNA [Choloepus didactylus]XP_037654571.1 microtubule organization protein AKNA [Choloepus didactylus]XP_037654572.1 microtubule organization protein AKNA [Choloepus didactylus]XP_037654573.1 microtubule organization protein AKNA [Cholo
MREEPPVTRVPVAAAPSPEDEVAEVKRRPGLMASSGTEANWAGPGLGQGPRRRRWAWAEEKDGGGSCTRSWGEEGPIPDATSPELLEDFRPAEQHQLLLEWDPQPDGHQDSESGESAGEDIEGEEVDSPESSNLPLSWFPQWDHQLNMTEEEPDEALRNPQEIEEAGEGSPRLGYKAGLCLTDKGSTSPKALGQGEDRGWLVAGDKASRDEFSEHSEVSPSVDLHSAGSWSSGTMSLRHPCDSLTSTWEGETDGPQPTPLVETLPQDPSGHLLDPDDRTGGNVAQATPTEFHDSSAPPPQSLCPGDGWRQTSSLSCSQSLAWKRTRISTKALPSRFTGSISSLSPQPRPAQQDRPPRLPRQGATLAGRSSDAAKYGRGQLNYPLPDFSKVGPRVRFPKDEKYQPPKARSHGRQREGPARPLIFKSPAEIVREVLLSSGETCPAKDPPPAHPITRIPQEFQTPEQATELVHQLQEDYHKLLTKYAEAENTIDQLRLGAKVNLYSDPPRPSHSLHMGTVPQGTKVLSFTIPQARTAEWQPGPTGAPQASEAAGWQLARGDLSPSSPTDTSTPARLPKEQGITEDQPSVEQTQALASQASQFLTKVKCFEELVQAGWLIPQDQLKGFRQLKAAHTALEEQYLEACRKQQHLEQQLAGSQGPPGRFDPDRELEAEIFQLGIRLEELKDHMEQSQLESERPGSDSALDSPPATPTPCKPTCPPSPSTPAIQTPYPEPDDPRTRPCPLHVDVDLSYSSSKVEDRPRDLLAPLRHKELQVEQDFHGLLERYLSVKSLPEAMSAEEEEEQGCTLEVDGLAPVPGRAQATRLPPQQLPGETAERMVSMKPPGSQTSVDRDGHPPGLGKAKAAPPGPGTLPCPRTTKSAPSHRSSMTNLVESDVSERLPQKSFHQAGGPHLEEPWMASPETDSGFVGSETSRVSPLTQTPEHRLSHVSTPGTSAQPFTASVPQDGASHLQARGPPVPRTAAEHSTPRSRAQRHLPGPGSPLRQKAPSFCMEQVLAAEMAVPGLELEGRKRISEQLLPSRAISPTPVPTPEAAPLTDGPTEAIPSLLLSRTGRDRAIRELREEVSRLRLRLEDSLHQPAQGSPKRPASTFTRPARARARPADSSAAWGSHYGSKSTERLSGEPGGTEQAVPAGRRRARSSSVPREVPRLSLTSESEPTSPQLSSDKNRAAKQSPPAAQDGMRGGGSSRRRDRVIFQGHYTGQEYHLLSPKSVPRGGGTVSCPHCRPSRTQGAGGATTRDPQGSSPADPLRCPMCHRVGPHPEADGPNSAATSTEKASRKNAPSHSSPKQRRKQLESPPRLPPGLWYLAAAPPAPASPAFAYVPSVPIVPYPPATVYYAPPGSTSAPAAQAAAEWPPTASSRPPAQLPLDDLEELSEALSRAVRAARSVRATTRHMSRSLLAALHQARSPRGSCLF